MNMKPACVLLSVVLSATLSAQSSPPSPADSADKSVAASSGAASGDLGRLQAFASQSAQLIAALHIEKWKVNGAARSTAQANADSLHRNLTDVLPGLIESARANPTDVNAQFKLYRDVNALYEVLDGVTESSRIFGQKGQYESLSAQLRTLGSVRRNLGEGLEDLTASTQSELQQLRAEHKNDQQKLAMAEAATAEARKQVILAQAELEKKPAPRKKSAAKKPAATTSSASSSPVSASAQPQAAANPPKQ
jgi:hypothetical protein